MQTTVECILFNCLFFFYHRINDFKNQINEYNSIIHNYSMKMKQKPRKKIILIISKKKLECLSILYKIYVENLGYFLKILNKIYRDAKYSEKQKQGKLKFFKNMFKSQAEGVKKTGSFLLMEQLYNECPTLNLNETNNINIVYNFYKIYIFNY